MRKLIYAVITVVLILFMYPIEGDDLNNSGANQMILVAGS